MRHCAKEVGSLFHPKVRWGEDSIFDAPAGIGGEACPAGSVEGVYGFQQADGADGDQVFLIAGLGVVFLVMCATSRRLWRMSFSRAAGSPLRSAAKVSTSSFGVSGRGKLPESRWSARYRNFVAKNCKKILNAALSDLRTQRRREKAQY